MRTNEPPDFDFFSLSHHPGPGAFAPGPASAHLAPGPVLVYDLRRNTPAARDLYDELGILTRRTLEEIDAHAAILLQGYREYVVTELREAPRTRGEYAIELLTVGMAVCLYGEAALETPGWAVDLARELVFLRSRSPGAKPFIDFFRAGIFQLFMTRGLASRNETWKIETCNPSASKLADRHGLHMLRLVTAWMQATGEFPQEACRLEYWLSYLRTLPPWEAEAWIDAARDLFIWFQTQAESSVGQYTAGTRHFLESTWSGRFWREDQLFCGRLPVEYHLALVAAQVMNDAMRADFAAKPRKVLLVPACMRGKNADTCTARVDGVDISCAACDPDCAVNRITRLMRAQGVETYIVPHSTGFSRWLDRWQQLPEVGVAAVACLSNILAGGYDMRARGIASQCVPLDYPGCRKHWSEDGIPTTVDEVRLVQIVTGKPSTPPS